MPIILPGATIKAWNLMTPDIIPHVPGCPLFEIEARALQAAREFCRRSYCWRSPNVTLLTTVANQLLYDYANPAQAELNQVHTAWNGSTEVEVALPGETDDTAPDVADSTWKIMVDSEAQLRLTPPPDASGAVLKGTVSYKPKVDATGLPSIIFDQFRLEIAAGAIALLTSQADRPWTNPMKAGGMDGTFEKGITDASNMSGPVRRVPLRTKAW